MSDDYDENKLIQFLLTRRMSDRQMRLVLNFVKNSAKLAPLSKLLVGDIDSAIDSVYGENFMNSSKQGARAVLRRSLREYRMFMGVSI